MPNAEGAMLVIRHSSFVIRHSSFVIRHSRIPFPRRRACATLPAVLCEHFSHKRPVEWNPVKIGNSYAAVTGCESP
jgi:hypothetical protein